MSKSRTGRPPEMSPRTADQSPAHRAGQVDWEDVARKPEPPAPATNSGKPRESASRASLVISMLALGTSAFGVFNGLQVNRDASVKEAIDRSFGQFIELADIQRQDWRLSHMFQREDAYADTCKLLEIAALDIGPAARAELLLREHGIAELIFTSFQGALYQWRQASETGDARLAFYKDVVDYYTDRLLRNPRLVYWWEQGGYGNLSKVWIREYYEAHVVAGRAFESIADVCGPYGE